ncbi:MAG: hypothetical protein NT138_05115 [Planctomycetales bacterium]|nr:hypothetical protein [Planctomycetales bacterium]
MKTSFLLTAVWCFACAPKIALAQNAIGEQKFAPDQAAYEKTVTPFLKEHCLRCHGETTQEADFRVDTQLTADLSDRVNRQRWNEVVDVLNSHSMPPESEPQPKAESAAAVVDFITNQTLLAETISRGGQKGVRNRLLWMERLLGNLGSWEDQNDQLPGGGFIMC